MTQKTPDLLKLFGTEEIVPPAQVLTAGPITCEFDQGALRYIKFQGTEAIRNIAFVVRDKDWGTYSQVLHNVQIDQTDTAFTVNFDASCQDDLQEIRYQAKIKGSSDGTLTFLADYTAETDFLTNRTGFVVLHPVNNIAGKPLTVEHTNGEIQQDVFPALIDPVQPFKDIRALTHEVAAGLQLHCRLLGDTFEMEDHRQWNDASYKTYVRPLALPWPYTIPATTKKQQSVNLTATGTSLQSRIAKPNNTQHTGVITISKMESSQPMPRIGLGLEPQHLADTLTHLGLLKNAAPQQLTVWHEFNKHNTTHLKQAAHIAHAIKADIELQAVIPDIDFKTEIETLAHRCHEANMKPGAVHVAPAIYLKSIMPGPSWPPVTSLEDLYKEVKRHFPGAVIGGGMLSFFPELNRHRPPLAHLDFVSHASNTITHASDDITVTENLEALPHIINTARSIAGNKPYHAGPSSIAMRFNPYGSRTMDNPDNQRIAMARIDPRQRGLINAAWTVGYAAHMIRGGLACISLHAPTGEFGIISCPADWARPGFDHTCKEVYPAYHVLAGLAQAAGKPKILARSTISRELEAFGYENNGELIVWIANLTRNTQSVEIKGLHCTDTKIATLSAETFDPCTDTSTGFENTTTELDRPFINLGPYCVVRVTTIKS